MNVLHRATDVSGYRTVRRLFFLLMWGCASPSGIDVMDLPEKAPANSGMGIPIIAGAGIWKTRSVMTGGAGDVDVVALAAGVIAAALSGWLAIGLLLRYLRTHSTGIFIAYRLLAAAVFLVLLLLVG